VRRSAHLLLIMLLVVLGVSACGGGPTLDSWTTESTDRGAMAVSAVYLTPATGGELSAADLAAHPNIVVVHDQAELESAVQSATAIWIDRGAVPSLDLAWLRERVVDRYPIALIGYGDALYAFRETLEFGRIRGPYVDWAKKTITPGFSVWMTRRLDENGVEAYMNGFAETPTVGRVLAVTDPLLAESPPSITASSTTAATVSSSVPKPTSATTATRLFPAVDTFLGQLRLDVKPRQGVRVAVGGLRERPSGTLDPRKRLIEGELIIENRSDTPFTYGPDDFRLYVGPFQSQIEGVTASTEFPVEEAILAPVQAGDHPFLTAGTVAAGETVHGYLLTWLADRGTQSTRLQYNPSDPESGDGSYVLQIQP
jgi:hypothetical protein